MLPQAARGPITRQTKTSTPKRPHQGPSTTSAVSSASIVAKHNPLTTQHAAAMGSGPRSGSAMWQCDTDAEPEAPVQMSYTLTGKELVCSFLLVGGIL
jgi:hypothetical protein